MEENTSRVYVGQSAASLAEPLVANHTPGAGTQLFVINLCASIAPIQAAGKTIPGFENYKLYQVARNEDGRTRHRLRLGFFTSEADAEQVLTSVRDNYPTAFVACLSDDDRRYTRGFVTDAAPAKRTIAVVEKPAPAPTAVAAPAVAKPAAKPPVAKEPAKPAAPASVAPAAAAIPNTSVQAAKPSAPAAVRAAPAAQKVPAAKAAAAPSAPAVIAVEWQPETKSAAKAEAPKATAPAADEIELSWDPPALQPDSSKAAGADTSASIKTVAPVFKTDTVIKARPTEAPKPKAAAPAKPASASSAPVELTLEKDSAPTKPVAATPATTSAQPFHVGKGIEIPATALSLEATGAVAATAPANAPASQSVAATKAPAKPAAVAKSAPAKPAPSAPSKSSPSAAAIAQPAIAKTPLPPTASTDRHAPELDSTQTIRALTNAELNDEEKWFSIQLVVSEQPVNLDAMPHLDIFEAYRVYSVANAGSGKIVYSLRLGFFREEVSAEAVTGYLKTFFPAPSVIRISTAEQLRFKDAPAPKATAAAAAKSDAKVIELNQARDRKPTIPTVTMEVDPAATGSFKPNATGSFKVNASGTHKALKPAAKVSPPATRRSAPIPKASATGKHKALSSAKKSLQEQLLDEARDVQLSESAIRKLPKSDSLLSRLVGKLTK